MTRRPLLFATLDGYALEGGYDRAYEPSTCYRATIALGRHAGPGDALGLWRDYELVLDLAKQLGLDGVRLSAEWARIEPRQGEVDQRALERYGEVVRYANEIGLGVSLALIDACWPSWLGLEAWLLPWVVPHVLEHARRMVSHFDTDITGVVVFADADRLVDGGYLEGTSPPWRRGQREDAARVRAQLEHIVTQLGNDA
ncbi:MAG: family 1 glycosylhydrolase, partial [Acidimicrobiales bacterium]